MNTQKAERYLYPKELAASFDEHGKLMTVDFARAIIKACPESLGNQVRFSDALAWWKANPDFHPHRKGPKKSESARVCII